MGLIDKRPFLGRGWKEVREETGGWGSGSKGFGPRRRRRPGRRKFVPGKPQFPQRALDGGTFFDLRTSPCDTFQAFLPNDLEQKPVRARSLPQAEGMQGAFHRGAGGDFGTLMVATPEASLENGPEGGKRQLSIGSFLVASRHGSGLNFLAEVGALFPRSPPEVLDRESGGPMVPVVKQALS